MSDVVNPETPEPRKGWRPIFDPVITWGHLVSAMLMCGTVIGIYSDSKAFRREAEMRFGWIEERFAEQEAAAREQSKTLAETSKALNRLVTLAEREDTERARLRR